MVEGRDITLGLVAGGQGRRLGGVAKGLLEVGGRASLEWLLDLAPGLGCVLLGAPDASPYAAFGLDPVADVVAGKGAPGGVVSLLLAAKTPWVLCVACDMPFVRPAHVEALRLRAGPDVDAVVAARRGARVIRSGETRRVDGAPLHGDGSPVDPTRPRVVGAAQQARTAPANDETAGAHGSRPTRARTESLDAFEPLLGLYRSSLGREWLPQLAQNPSLRSLVASSRWAAVELDPDALDSLNTPDDLARARARGG
ncbi:MAG: molybdenum cofactor guanylyltransferase [Myxococcaceae bacterium]|nr:molybdenum cofactor guanylyltransferase [Myxococcaceae bacterium]